MTEYEPKILRSIALNHKAGDAQAKAKEMCKEQGISLEKMVKVPDYSGTPDHVLYNITQMGDKVDRSKVDAALSEMGSRE
tara:strand:+ start:286 stop:525 length:240 start_codon:yes stop_codon:yes gene_type:complete